jgi:hypothetical protein
MNASNLGGVLPTERRREAGSCCVRSIRSVALDDHLDFRGTLLRQDRPGMLFTAADPRSCTITLGLSGSPEASFLGECVVNQLGDLGVRQP